MTVTTWDHRDLHPEGLDVYSRPSFHGYPEEDDEVRVVYESKRTGRRKDTVGTVDDVWDHSRGPNTAHPAYLELVIDDGRDREVRVWGGGGYTADDIDTEGEAPAQVWTSGFVDDGHGGRTRRTNALGRLISLEAPEGVTYEVTVRDVPTESLDGVEDRIESAVGKHFKYDSTAQDLLTVDVEQTKRLDR